MTSPPAKITVACPECAVEYRDFYRPSINLSLEGWDPDDPEVKKYLRECETATCPACGHVVELDILVVEGDVWTFREGDAKAERIDLDWSPETRDWIKGRDDSGATVGSPDLPKQAENAADRREPPTAD